MNAPWSMEVEYISLERKGTTGNYIIRDAGGEYIGKVLSHAAPVIAAAPELLVALEDLYRECLAAKNYQTYFPQMKQAAEALAKVKGERP